MIGARRPTEQMSVSNFRLIETSILIIKAFLVRNATPPAVVPDLLSAVYKSLEDIERLMEAPTNVLEPPVPINKTIKRDFIISLENGKPYRSLTRHLSARGLTPELYRKKWGLSDQYPMAASGFSKQRSAAAIAQGFGRKRRAGGMGSSNPAKM
jgi:predicted transcriptional regulator